MPSDSSADLPGLDYRDILIEAASVLSIATNDEDLPHLLQSSYDPSEVEPLLQLFGLKMPLISETRLTVSPTCLLAQSVKHLRQYDTSAVPLAEALVCLNLLGLCASEPLADVLAEVFWNRIWDPLKLFLHSAVALSEPLRTEGEFLSPPSMVLRASHSWEAHDPILLGDSLWWAKGMGPLFHTLGGWNSTWAMPPRPAEGDHEMQIAYWAPLVHLVLGPLGWTDPALGLAKWILRGMPVAEPAMRILRDVWGSDALAFFCTTDDWMPSVKQKDEYRSGVLARRSAFADQARTKNMIGYGEFHMGMHISSQMFHSEFSNSVEPVGRIFEAEGSEGVRERVLLLGRFAGWYGNLHRLGERLRPDSEIHVVAPPIGYVGKYQKDRSTLRWHSVSDLTHGWGN